MTKQTTREVIEILAKHYEAVDFETFRETVLEGGPNLKAREIVALGITDTEALNRAISAIFWWEV